MAITISEYIDRLSEFPGEYLAEAYEGEDHGLRIMDENEDGVDFISDY